MSVSETRTQQAIERLREQHREADGVCNWDAWGWPCDTAIVLDAYDAAIARAEAAERVVEQLAEDIERRLMMGVGTISSQHVLRQLGRPWTFEDVSERRLHGRETVSIE